MLVGVNDVTCYNCGRRNPGLWGYGPMLRALGRDLGFVPFVIGTCAVIYVLTLISSRDIGTGGLMSFGAPGLVPLVQFGASGVVPVFGLGRWWTVLSAGWLHGGVLHILFNMMSVRQIAPAIADLYGPGRMVIIYTAGSIAGFTLSTLAGAFAPRIPFLSPGSFTLGASAAIFGLVGALVYYGKRSGSSYISSQASSMAFGMAVFGFLMPGIDNYAHAGGFAGGYLAARLLDPLKPERIDHMLLAVLCLVASLGSVAASLLVGSPIG